MSKPLRQKVELDRDHEVSLTPSGSGEQASLRGAIELVDDFQAQPLEASAPEAATPALEPVLRPKKRWLLRLIGITGLGVVAMESGLTLSGMWSGEPVRAGLYSALLALIGFGLARLGWREWRQLRQLRRQGHFQQQACALQLPGDASSVEATRWAEQVMRQLGPQLPVEGREHYLAQLADSHNRQEVLDLFSSNVLAPLDQQALSLVRRWSSEAAVMVAVSPLASLDMLLILWRNQRLVEEIAAVYGVKLGYWSRITLLRQILVNIVYAGSSEVIADLGISTLGADLTSKLSARMAQGLGAGLLTARLGLKCLQLCRPLPFDERQKPRLGELRKGLLGELGKLSAS